MKHKIKIHNVQVLIIFTSVNVLSYFSPLTVHIVGWWRDFINTRWILKLHCLTFPCIEILMCFVKCSCNLTLIILAAVEAQPSNSHRTFAMLNVAYCLSLFGQHWAELTPSILTFIYFIFDNSVKFKKCRAALHLTIFVSFYTTACQWCPLHAAVSQVFESVSENKAEFAVKEQWRRTCV